MTAGPAPHRPAIAPEAKETGPQRALILAGGGIRVAYQAGVIRALHDAGLRFGHADGASGGILNLAMLCSGLTPREMGERWRTLNPRDSISLLPPRTYLRPHALPALGDADGLIDEVFPHLGIDVARIRASEGMVATFNVASYTRKTNVAFTHDQIDQDLLVAGVSLPIFLPPVRRGDELFLDSVWIRDANLMEAVRRGAEELWVVWCIGNTAAYHDGGFAQYVHMIELSANGALFEEFDRIAELNGRIARGDSPYGQTGPIRLHLIRPAHPLPLDPAYYLGQIDGATLVAMGYADARAYLDGMSDAGQPLVPETTRMETERIGLTFRERLTGSYIRGQPDPDLVHELAREPRTPIALNLSVVIRDLDRFLVDRAATADVFGHLDGDLFGLPDAGPPDTDIPCRRGTFRMIGPTEGRDETRLAYEIGFVHHRRDYLLAGDKVIGGDASDGRRAGMMTLPVRLHEGSDRSGPVVGSGALRLSTADLARLTRSLTVTNAPTLRSQAIALGRVGRLLLGGPSDAGGEAEAAGPLATGPGSLRFTEEMKGFVAFGEPDSARGETQGRLDGTRLMVHLTIRIDDVERFVGDPAHAAAAVGWVGCDALGGKLPIEHGMFQLFVDDGNPLRKEMRYRLRFRDAVGHPLTLVGCKVVENDAGFDPWQDTTTLYTRLLGGHPDSAGDQAAPVVGAGIIRIQPMGFLRQMTTFRTDGPSLGAHAASALRFGRFFAGNLWTVYGPGTAGRDRPALPPNDAA